MPTFGRTGNGKWHVVGPDGCRYGRAFADDPDSVPDETVTATDIVTYDPLAGEDDRSSADAIGFGGFVPRGSLEHQQLVLPSEIRNGDSELCNSCRSRLETHQKRRAQLISEFKHVVPLRDIDWTSTESESLQVCYWCRAHESVLWVSDPLRSQVCPACGRLYNSSLGDPGPDDTPEEDLRPATPTEFVTPIVFGATLPEYDPTELVGSNRPLIEVREKNKYATLKFDLERTGHAFTPEAIDALEEVRDAYVDEVTEDESHQADVKIDVGMFARSVTLEGVYPDDAASVVGDCWDIVGNPANWFSVRWPQHGRLYGLSAERSIPGDEPVIDVFPRLKTQSPASSVDTDALKQVTDPGRYQRGEGYYNRGAVTDIQRVDNRLQATVQGSQPYDVRVTLEHGRYVDGQCSCPDDAVPCKHIVAAVLASDDVEPVGGERPLEEILAGATREELETLLLDVVEDDLLLRKRIYDEFNT